jgi:hypothetical protein
MLHTPARISANARLARIKRAITGVPSRQIRPNVADVLIVWTDFRSKQAKRQPVKIVSTIKIDPHYSPPNINSSHKANEFRFFYFCVRLRFQIRRCFDKKRLKHEALPGNEMDLFSNGPGRRFLLVYDVGGNAPLSRPRALSDDLQPYRR